MNARDQSWAVCDMDDGVLRREPTRGAAVRWLLAHHCADRVLWRLRYRRGDYEYGVGDSPDEQSSAWIVRADLLHHGGWDPDQAALYPVAGDPHRHVDRPASVG